MALGKQPEVDFDDDEGAIFSDINITPLTDIFLVLLIMFMVGSTIAVKKVQSEVKDEKSAGLKINLPQGQAREIDPGRVSLVVGIQVDGRLAVNGELLKDDSDLQRVLQSAFSRNKDTQIVIRADQDSRSGKVVSVMEQAKRIGLHRIAIATKSGG
jgi:biopolymer transport protein ExbD